MTCRHAVRGPDSWWGTALWRFARNGGRGVARMASVLTTPLIRAWTWLWHSRGAADRQADPTELSMVMWPDGRVAVPEHDRSVRIASFDVDVIAAEPEFGERLDAAVLARLQLGPQPKLLDLRTAPLVKVALFEHLAGAWQAPRGTVGRLGIFLDYERWVILHGVAARRLQPIVDRGVDVEIFYPQQGDSMVGWFAGDEVCHDHLGDVIDWLRTEWRPGAIWPSVLSRTASLVQESAEVDAVPEMLLELAAIARSFGGTEGAEQAAKHARAALEWIGDEPSSMRCRALREAAGATLAMGQTEPGLALLETALTTATVLRDRIEVASALAEIASYALQRGFCARAEARLRAALELVSQGDSDDLLARLHHDLAVALLAQQSDLEEAEHHASTALGLRRDPRSQLASEDIALIARIRAQQATPHS